MSTLNGLTLNTMAPQTQQSFIKSLILISLSLTMHKHSKKTLHYHLTLHCEVRSPSEMVNVAPRRRAEAINRNLTSILKAGIDRVCVQYVVRPLLNGDLICPEGLKGQLITESCGKLAQRTVQHRLTRRTQHGREKTQFSRRNTVIIFFTTYSALFI